MTAPGTSGRSPNPPRGAAAAAASGGGTNAAGRSSIGSIASLSSVQGGGGNGPRSSIGSIIAGGGIPTTRGTRLSYGMGSAAAGGSAITSSGAGGSSAMAAAGGITPAQHRRPTSPPSTSSTNDDGEPQSDFLAALSPTTAKFLRGRGFPRGAAAAAGGGGGGGVSAMTAEAGGDASSSSSSLLSASDVMEGNINNKNKDDNDDVNMTDNNVKHNAGVKRGSRQPNATNNDQRMTINNNTNNNESETDQLRKLVRSLLGMHLPTTTSTSAPTMTTPDPATAAFFAVALLAKTDASSSTTTCDDENENENNGGGVSRVRQHQQQQQHGCRWRPDDAYLAARALSLKGEHKRAIYILDKVGLIGFGIGAGGEGDVSGGSILHATATTATVGCDNGRHTESSVTSNVAGLRNALLLRAESALLAGQCLIHAGEYERALTVYEEAMRYPPPPPPVEWGLYGYGYRLDGHTRRDNDDDNDGRDEMGEVEEEEEELNARLADGSYIHAWREQSLSHMALIDDGDDERLVLLAENIRPMAFSSSLVDVDGHHQHASVAAMAMHGIHPVARLCVARGIAYDAISNPHRAVSFLKAAMTIDARCVEALDYVVKRRLLTPEEERSWVSSLNFGGLGSDSMSISWLRDAYLTRLRGMGYVSTPTGASVNDEVAATDSMISPVPRTDLLSPSMLSLSSPDFAGGAVDVDSNDNQLPVGGQFVSSNNQLSSGRTTTLTIDGAFRNLAIAHKLGRCPDILSHAAIRSYALHDLSSALAYCTAIDAIDPFCRTAGYVHVATLVGLNLKRRLFHLAHRLVDTDPKDSLAWFAVGSYYYACRRFDLAQRHFSRATRLDPSSAECWIGFGCSFAVCDESDQALASFRAAQNKYSGSSVPLLYMGMEYLRTNHLSLAGHFLNSAQRTDPCDMLCCNELGVWCYRQGNLEDAAFWFMKALRLHVRAESSVLRSTDEGLGMDGYILLTGLPSTAIGGRADAASDHDYVSTPHLQRRSNSDGPPMSSVLCALKTPSGKSIAASFFSDTIDVDNDGLTDLECIERCMDQCWEPAIFNLGQNYRKLKRYGEAIVCFEKCTSLNPVSWYLVDGVWRFISHALNMSLTNIIHDIKN